MESVSVRKTTYSKLLIPPWTVMMSRGGCSPQICVRLSYFVQSGCRIILSNLAYLLKDVHNILRCRIVRQSQIVRLVRVSTALKGRVKNQTVSCSLRCFQFFFLQGVATALIRATLEANEIKVKHT